MSRTLYSLHEEDAKLHIVHEDAKLHSLHEDSKLQSTRRRCKTTVYMKMQNYTVQMKKVQNYTIYMKKVQNYSLHEEGANSKARCTHGKKIHLQKQRKNTML
jgi:hypothetical protein